MNKIPDPVHRGLDPLIMLVVDMVFQLVYPYDAP